MILYTAVVPACTCWSSTMGSYYNSMDQTVYLTVEAEELPPTDNYVSEGEEALQEYPDIDEDDDT
jgi:hypothetical protein